VLNGAGAVGALYGSYAFDLLRRPGGYERGAAAAHQAVALAPWRAESHMRLAEARLIGGDHDGALAATTLRLQWAPADAYAWLQLASVYRADGRFDSRLQAAYQSAQRRAPQSPSLDFLIAMDGLRDWRFGDAALRSIWLGAMERTLRRNRGLLLREVVVRHREQAFCDYTLPHLPALGPWCEDARRLRKACAQKDLRADQLAWCENAGFATKGPYAR
jgi:tetratricopeptide (TPR) repeat protein